MEMITIIVPFYNSSKFLKQTLETVRNQSFDHWECLLIDDGSNDGCKEICDYYLHQDSRFKLFSQKNKGVSAARNLGLSLARGSYIQFLDSDDLLGLGKLEAHFNFLIKNPDVDVIYSGSRYFESYDSNHFYLMGRNFLMGTVEITKFDTDLLRLVLLRNPFVTSSPLYRRSVFERVGKYDENLFYLEDWDFQLRCVLSKIVFQFEPFSPETGVLVRLHNKSLMTNRKAVLQAKKIFYNKYAYLDSFGLFPPKNLLVRINRKLRWIFGDMWNLFDRKMP